MDGGDGGGEGEGEAEEGEEGARAQERDGVVAGLVPDVARLDARAGDARDGLEVEDAGLEGEGGDCEGEG